MITQKVETLGGIISTADMASEAEEPRKRVRNNEKERHTESSFRQ